MDTKTTEALTETLSAFLSLTTEIGSHLKLEPAEHAKLQARLNQAETSLKGLQAALTPDAATANTGGAPRA